MCLVKKIKKTKQKTHNWTRNRYIYSREQNTSTISNVTITWDILFNRRERKRKSTWKIITPSNVLEMHAFIIFISSFILNINNVLTKLTSRVKEETEDQRIVQF